MLDTVTASAERKQDTGCWMLDVGSWILDTGCWSLVFFLGVRHCDRAFGGSSTKQFIL